MNISANDLRRAAAIKDKIETLQSELAKVLGSDHVGDGSTPLADGRKGKRRRKMSAAAKAKIAAAAKARWAKVKAAGKKRL